MDARGVWGVSDVGNVQCSGRGFNHIGAEVGDRSGEIIQRLRKVKDDFARGSGQIGPFGNWLGSIRSHGHRNRGTGGSRFSVAGYDYIIVAIIARHGPWTIAAAGV